MIKFRVISSLGIITNKISMKVCVHVHVWAPLSFGKVLRTGSLELYNICMMNIFINCQMFSRTAIPVCILTSRVQECQYLHILVSTQYNNFHFRHLNDCVVVCPGSSLHFLSTNEVCDPFELFCKWTYALKFLIFVDI